MANTLTTAQSSLMAYIKQLKITPVKCDKARGFMLYTIPTQVEIDKLVTLVSKLNSSWKLIQGSKKGTPFQPDGTQPVNQIYIGHASSKNDMNNKDDYVAIDWS